MILNDFYKDLKNTISFKDIKTNTKDILPGDIFVAIKGNTYDGHNYIKEALDKKIVTINDLKVLGLKYYIREINKNDTNKPVTNIPKLIWELKDSNSTANKNTCINDPKLGVICIFYNEILSQKNKIITKFIKIILKNKCCFVRSYNYSVYTSFSK